MAMAPMSRSKEWFVLLLFPWQRNISVQTLTVDIKERKEEKKRFG